MFSPESDRPVVLQDSRALEKNGEGRRGFCKIAVMFVFATAAALVCAATRGLRQRRGQYVGCRAGWQSATVEEQHAGKYREESEA